MMYQNIYYQLCQHLWKKEEVVAGTVLIFEKYSAMITLIYYYFWEISELMSANKTSCSSISLVLSFSKSLFLKVLWDQYNFRKSKFNGITLLNFIIWYYKNREKYWQELFHIWTLESGNYYWISTIMYVPQSLQ